MYEIEFYETEDGKCPIWDFLEALRLKAPTNKDARIRCKRTLEQAWVLSVVYASFTL